MKKILYFIISIKLILCLTLLFNQVPLGSSFSCFNCSSVNDNYCPEKMDYHDEGIVPYVDCSDIFDAKYCIKTTGVNGGSLGTTRSCSSKDVGNYCEYIQRPGDYLEYRSCVYTCSSNGCNGVDGSLIKSSTSALQQLIMTIAVGLIGGVGINLVQ